MILRLEEFNNDASINMIRCLCVTGIPNLIRKIITVSYNYIAYLLEPNISFKHYFTPNFISTHRMVAQIAQVFQSSQSKIFTGQHFSAIHSHMDLLDYTNISDIDSSKLNYYLLLPGFTRIFKESAVKLILEKKTAPHIKHRLLGHLTCSLVFLAQSQKDLIENLKDCFDIALYVRATENCPVNESKLSSFDPHLIPYFQNILDADALSKAIHLLLE